MANGLQRAAQAPPPAELDDVFVIASQRFLRPPRTCCAAEFQTGVCRHGVILDRVSRFCPLAHFRCALKPDLRLGRQTRRTRRSFTSGTPRDLFGSIGLMATHYWRADLTGPEPATGVVRGCRSRRIYVPSTLRIIERPPDRLREFLCPTRRGGEHLRRVRHITQSNDAEILQAGSRRAGHLRTSASDSCLHLPRDSSKNKTGTYQLGSRHDQPSQTRSKPQERPPQPRSEDARGQGTLLAQCGAARPHSPRTP